MIEFRPFLNTDPPRLVDIWRVQPPLRANVESISRDVLDKLVFGKPYFDRMGFIVAVEKSWPIGFVHAGFGPNEDQSDLNPEIGVISQLKVMPRKDTDKIAAELVEKAIDYLREKGAESCYGGSFFPHAPFYMGLYGGSRVPGVLAGDEVFTKALHENGFQAIKQFSVLSRNLTDYTPPTAREIMMAKRRFMIAPHVDPRERTWWECCSLGMADRDCFTLTDRRSRKLAGRVTFWDMMPLASEWGVQARGIYDMRIGPEFQDNQLELFLLSDSLKHLKEQGIGLVEAQTRTDNQKALEVFEQLEFEVVDGGVQFARAL